LINNTNYLTTALDKQNFDFTEKHFTVQAQEEDWKRGVNSVNGGLGIVGKVYKKAFSEAKEHDRNGEKSIESLC
jgi:putative endopeptidase